MHYLDLNERPAAVTAIRFGFAWVSARDQFVAITGHASVVRQLLSAACFGGPTSGVLILKQ